jgi:hypothetical protein
VHSFVILKAHHIFITMIGWCDDAMDGFVFEIFFRHAQ